MAVHHGQSSVLPASHPSASSKPLPDPTPNSPSPPNGSLDDECEYEDEDERIGDDHIPLRMTADSDVPLSHRESTFPERDEEDIEVVEEGDLEQYGSRRNSSHSSSLQNLASGASGNSSQLSRKDSLRASSSRKWLPALDVNTSLAATVASISSPVSSPRSVGVNNNSSASQHPSKLAAGSFTTARSPIAEDGHMPGSTFHRRRLSSSVVRRQSQEQQQQQYQQHPHVSSTHRPTSVAHPDEPGPSSPFGWLTGNLLTLPPADVKHSKSDDERETDDRDIDSAHHDRRIKPKRKKHWAGWNSTSHSDTSAPAISMTPPTTEAAYMSVPIPISSALAPLPHDPYNILPLSAASSPSGSRGPTPFHSPFTSPHASIGDLSSEFIAGATIAPASAPSVGATSSPRTSMSTSSSHLGWGVPRTWSDSSRSGEEDDSPTYAAVPAASWWWRGDPTTYRTSVHPVHSVPSRPFRSSKLLPSGTRRWTWLIEPIQSALGNSRTRETRKIVRQKSRSRNREREKLASRRPPPVFGSKWLGRAWAFVPTHPLTIFFAITFLAGCVVLITLTIKHILNPDKEALPYRTYCLAESPSIYSLQYPNGPQPPNLSLSDDEFASISGNPSPAANSLTPSPPNPVLTPLTPAHPLWPYDAHPPYNDLRAVSLDTVRPVGILIGVFTTDAGVERRNMIRQSYAIHWRSRREGTEGVRIRFVMGRPRQKYMRAVELEMEAFDDILLLDMPENMNSGKTHAFFSWAAENATVPDWEYPLGHPRSLHEMDYQVYEDGGVDYFAPIWRGERRPDYVVKADDDSFIMLGELERHLRGVPRTKAYWGYLVRNLFMAGECYALSFDLVEYIAASPALRTHTRGKEDKLVSKWMRMHPERESIVWVAERCWIYDHPKAGTVYSHGFLFPSEVAQIRAENRVELSPGTLALRGGPDAAKAYSTVSRFGATYRPLAPDLSVVEQVEALIEGSALSKIRDEPSSVKAENQRERILRLAVARPSRTERFMGDPEERGGTVVVHYIKRPEWFVETMVALLGTADEQAGYHRGVGAGLGMLEHHKGRVIPGYPDLNTGVLLSKDKGL